MAGYIGIYGFDITRPMDFAGIAIEPKFCDGNEAQKRAEDPYRFLLTAVGQINSGPVRELAFDLSAALTFCQQRWVIVTGPVRNPELTLKQFESELPSELDFEVSRQSGGALIKRDIFAPDSRQRFLAMCLPQLRDTTDRSEFRSAFFRCVEVWRMDPAYVDLTYYLTFSALEILVRNSTQDYKTDIAQLMCSFLKKLGFDVEQDNSARRVHSMQTYVHLRNALFHNGRFEKVISENGREIVLKLTDYESNWRRLIPDVLLRVLGFDDGYVNWNRWLDRMPWR